MEEGKEEKKEEREKSIFIDLFFLSLHSPPHSTHLSLIRNLVAAGLGRKKRRWVELYPGLLKVCAIENSKVGVARQNGSRRRQNEGRRERGGRRGLKEREGEREGPGMRKPKKTKKLNLDRGSPFLQLSLSLSLSLSLMFFLSS